MHYSEIFKIRLRSLRQTKGLSQKAVAEKLKLSENGYLNYEMGRRKPTFDILITLANFFEVSIDYLVGRTDNQDSHKL